MKILHTSDWHLGRMLYNQKRYLEFEAFLDWLVQFIKAEHIDALLIAGDVFDTNTPSNKAQSLYYQFLSRIAQSDCRHIIITAGNHDSPSFLNAPKNLLAAFNIHIVGSVNEQLSDEVITLKDTNGKPEAIVCAVPYLRDKDVRTFEAGESLDDKNHKLIQGVKNHYQAVCSYAHELQQEYLAQDISLPIIGMGHLFASGGKTLDGDGVRELYVGSLAHVSADIFPNYLDYVALGHLHVPQLVAKNDTIRYSGSPIPMGFNEARQQKVIITIEFSNGMPTIISHPVPCFQQLLQVKGDLPDILMSLQNLKSSNSNAWLEIEYTGTNIVSDLRSQIDQIIDNTQMTLLKVYNRQITSRLLAQNKTNETLDDLKVEDVFNRCLDAFNISDDERPELTYCFNEIVKSIHEDDVNAL